jgi:hypothetical protein
MDLPSQTVQSKWFDTVYRATTRSRAHLTISLDALTTCSATVGRVLTQQWLVRHRTLIAEGPDDCVDTYLEMGHMMGTQRTDLQFTVKAHINAIRWQ